MKLNLLFGSLVAVLLLSNCDPTKKINQSDAYSGDIDTSYAYDYDYYDETTDDYEYTYEDDYIEEPESDISPWSKDRYRATATRSFDLLHTSLSVSFNWEKAQMNGKASLILRPYFYTTSELVLDAKGMDIHRIAAVEGNSKRDLSFTYDSLQLTIDLGRDYTRNDSVVIYIDYTARPNDLPEGGSAAITSAKGLYFINPNGTEANKPQQIWTQGETEASSCWFPTIDKPNERCTQEIYITFDRKYKTLSNGVMINSYLNNDGTRTDQWVMQQPHAPYLFMMAVGEFSVVKDSWKGKDVHYYVEPEYEPYARQIFGNTPEMMTFYSELLGVEYPWDKYNQVVVRDYVSGAMENTTATIHGEFLQQTDRELLDETWEDVISHELFHQWFGDLVTTESWSNLPLNESFATYGEYLWREYKYGREDADEHLKGDYDAYMAEATDKQVDMIRFEYTNKEDMFDSHSYAKGGCILHMLRKYVGDDAFFNALQLYLEDNRFSSVEIHNLRLAFEEVTGEDLNWFFNQWFLNSGHPELYVSTDYDADAQMLTLSMEQLQSAPTPIYVLPLDIDIYVNGSKERHRITLDNRYQDFTFPVSSQPDWVDIDGENMLLAAVTYEQEAEQASFIYRQNSGYLDRLKAIYALESKQEYSEAATSVLMEALQDPFWSIREAAVGALMVSSGDAQMADAIIRLATTDPNSKVRAAAVGRLTDLDMPQSELEALLQAATQDSSYMVTGQALMLWNEINPEAAEQVARQYMMEKNLNIIIPVWEILALNGNPKDNDYFLYQFEKISGWQVYYLLVYYQEFLKHQSDLDIIQKGANQFKAVALDESGDWITFFANSFLSGLYEYYNESMSEQDADTQAAWKAGMEYIQETLREINMGWGYEDEGEY